MYPIFHYDSVMCPLSCYAAIMIWCKGVWYIMITNWKQEEYKTLFICKDVNLSQQGTPNLKLSWNWPVQPIWYEIAYDGPSIK